MLFSIIFLIVFLLLVKLLLVMVKMQSLAQFPLYPISYVYPFILPELICYFTDYFVYRLIFISMQSIVAVLLSSIYPGFCIVGSYSVVLGRY